MVQIVDSLPTQQTMRQQAVQQGMGQFFNGMQDYQKNQQQLQATQRQLALDTVKATKDLRDAGYDVTPEQLDTAIKQRLPQDDSFGGKISRLFGQADPSQQGEAVDLYGKRTQEWQDKQARDAASAELDKEAKRALIAGRNRAATTPAAPTYEEKLAARTEAADKNRESDAIRKATIANYDIADPSVIPSAKDAEEVKGQHISANAFLSGAGKAKEILRGYETLDRSGLTNKAKDFQQQISNLQVQAKNLFDLGVLNGPDLPLINSNLGAATSDIAVYGPEAALKRLGETERMIQEKLALSTSARGYRPKTTKATGGNQMSREEKIKLILQSQGK